MKSGPLFQTDRLPGDQPEAEIEYGLRREYRGRGLATEARS